MNTQNPQVPPPQAAPVAAPAPAVPAVVPPATPVTAPEGSQVSSQPATPPVTPAAAATPTAIDPLANSTWPKSAQDRVRDLARKGRERLDIINQKDAYIKELEGKIATAVHPKREQFPEGDAGDHAFVSAISAHNANLGGLAAEKIRATTELNTAKTESQKTFQELQLERVNAARAEFKDLDQVLQTSQLPVGQHLGYALQQADNGFQMMYILNKMHPEETARLNTLTWPEILQELPRVEAKYRASQQKPTPAAPAAPAAPITPPIEPIGGAGGAPQSGSGYKEWEAERNKKAELRF